MEISSTFVSDFGAVAVITGSGATGVGAAGVASVGVGATGVGAAGVGAAGFGGAGVVSAFAGSDDDTVGSTGSDAVDPASLEISSEIVLVLSTTGVVVVDEASFFFIFLFDLPVMRPLILLLPDLRMFPDLGLRLRRRDVCRFIVLLSFEVESAVTMVKFDSG